MPRADYSFWVKYLIAIGLLLVLLGLVFMFTGCATRGGILHSEPDLSDPTECVGRFMMLFADMESGTGRDVGFGPSDGISSGGEVLDRYEGTAATATEIQYITAICYLEDEEIREWLLTCFESRTPCPLEYLIESTCRDRVQSSQPQLDQP